MWQLGSELKASIRPHEKPLGRQPSGRVRLPCKVLFQGDNVEQTTTDISVIGAARIEFTFAITPASPGNRAAVPDVEFPLRQIDVATHAVKLIAPDQIRHAESSGNERTQHLNRPGRENNR